MDTEPPGDKIKPLAGVDATACACDLCRGESQWSGDFDTSTFGNPIDGRGAHPRQPCNANAGCAGAEPSHNSGEGFRGERH
jgi:hypothetical protein